MEIANHCYKHSLKNDKPLPPIFNELHYMGILILFRVFELEFNHSIRHWRLPTTVISTA